MKMAVFDFALRKKGVYGVLHIIILLLSHTPRRNVAHS